jgi:hypothetical protein
MDDNDRCHSCSKPAMRWRTPMTTCAAASAHRSERWPDAWSPLSIHSWAQGHLAKARGVLVQPRTAIRGRRSTLRPRPGMRGQPQALSSVDLRRPGSLPQRRARRRRRCHPICHLRVIPCDEDLSTLSRRRGTCRRSGHEQRPRQRPHHVGTSDGGSRSAGGPSGGVGVAEARTSINRGSVARPLPRANRVHPRNRVCASPGCRTRLSIYNSSACCWVHQPGRRGRLRDPRPDRPSLDQP